MRHLTVLHGRLLSAILTGNGETGSYRSVLCLWQTIKTKGKRVKNAET